MFEGLDRPLFPAAKRFPCSNLVAVLYTVRCLGCVQLVFNIKYKGTLARFSGKGEDFIETRTCKMLFTRTYVVRSFVVPLDSVRFGLVRFGSCFICAVRLIVVLELVWFGLVWFWFGLARHDFVL